MGDETGKMQSMMHLFEGSRLAATFPGNPSLASWLVSNRDTHDYEWTGTTYRLRWREPWRLIEALKQEN